MTIWKCISLHIYCMYMWLIPLGLGCRPFPHHGKYISYKHQIQQSVLNVDALVLSCFRPNKRNCPKRFMHCFISRLSVHPWDAWWSRGESFATHGARMSCCNIFKIDLVWPEQVGRRSTPNGNLWYTFLNQWTFINLHKFWLRYLSSLLMAFSRLETPNKILNVHITT